MSLIFINSNLGETSSILRISGPDAYTYLQGQFTQDLNHPPGAAGYGLWLNQRGKVVADSFILRRDSNEFVVASFSTRAARLRERLESYLVADEVEIADETEAWAWLQVWGEKAAEQIGVVFGSRPGAGNFAENKTGMVFRARAGAGGDAFAWLAPRESVPALAAKLNAVGAQQADGAAVERERIAGGIPSVPADLGPDDLPNEGGLDEIAISFTKGCYLGQEVMARLKNLGRVRRRLFVVRGPGAPPLPDTTLHQSGRKIGEVRSAAAEGDGFVALAMLVLLNFDPAAGVALAPDAAPALRVIAQV